MRFRKIACVGSGLVGHSWATLFAIKEYPVTIQDVDRDLLERALSRIRSNINFLVDKKLIARSHAETAMKNIQATTSIQEAVGEADYVQESVYENYEVKRKVFAKMDEINPRAILASSSSGLLITQIQKATKRPARCLIAHPFNPPHLIPLVELVPGEKTSAQTVEATAEFMRRLGKTPIILRKEVPGHIANRLSAALWREALDLIDKGVASVEDVDKALTTGPGIRWAIMGVNLTYHLGGLPGGIEYFVNHLGPAYSTWWRSMDPWTSIPYSAAKKVIEGVRQMEIVRTKTPEELTQWRDEKLVQLLKVIYGKPRR